jgi:thermitase
MYKKISYLLCSLALWSAASFGQGNSANSVPEKLIVRYRIGADRNQANKVFQVNGAKLEKDIPQLRLSVIRVPEAILDKAKKALEQSGNFEFVERDFTAHGSAAPNDPGYPAQWHLAKVQGPSAWDLTTGSSSAAIAYIDSGVDPSHPDLAAKLVAGWSFLTGTSNTADVLGHGTAVAGMSAITDNATGVAGLTWKNPIMPLVVLDATDYASYSNIASAITYAADHGVRVISISIAGSSPSSTLQSAVDYAWTKNSIVVAAAGNNSTSAPYYPAACDKVIAVSASDENDLLAGFSNYGNWIDVAAPGTNIYTTQAGGSYGYWYGTSFSAPIVASVAGLIAAIKPAISATDLVNTLLQSTDDIGAPGFDTSFGYGRVNAYKAALAASQLSSGLDTTPPKVSISNPVTGTTVSGTVLVQGVASDNFGVARLELSVDGQLNATATVAPFSFTWNTLVSPNGTHIVTVKAFDAAGNSTTYAAMVTVNNVVVSDSQPPTVSVTSPTNGSRVVNQVQINVAASDNVGIAQVSIYVDGVLLSTDTSAPYTYTWSAKRVASGTHTISAKAWDAAGNVSTSPSVTVNR